MSLLLFVAGELQAQTSWRGTADTSWSNPANWTAGRPTASVDAIIGDAAFTGPNQPSVNSRSFCRSLTIGTGARASTLTVSKALTVSGSVTIGPAGTINHSGRATISLLGDWINGGTYIGGHKRSIVTFAGANPSLQGPSSTDFRRVNINAGTRLSLRANISVATQFTVSGSVEPEESVPARTISGSGNGKLIVNSGGTLKVVAATATGNYPINSITLNAGSTVEYGSATLDQTVSSSWTYSILRISGGTTKTLAGNLPAMTSSSAGVGNLIVADGTLDLRTFTANRGTTTAGGTLTVADGSTLVVGGANNFPANFATRNLAGTSTVIYNGGNQTVTPQLYGHLTLTGGGGAATKTMPAGALTVAGNLSVSRGASPGVTATAGGPLTVRGGVDLGGSTVFAGGAFAHSFGGNWLNDGTYNGGSGSASFTGDGAILSGTGTNSFNDLNFSGAGVHAVANTSLSLGGNFTTSGAGSFTHDPEGTGTVTFTGAAKSISGNNITFFHVSIPGSVGTTTSLTLNGSLRVDGSLNATAGTVTLGGTGQSILGTGSIALFALHVPGTLTTARNLQLASDFSVTGSFTASAGTVNFVGTSIFSGAADLADVSVNGVALRLSAGSRLGVAGALGVVAGVFDTAAGIPNTVVYNGAGAQSLWTGAYHHLQIAGQNVKSASGPLVIRGDLTINPGGTFAAGAFSHRLAGDWLNLGTFNETGSQIVLDGTRDSMIQGATRFASLSVSKASPANEVRLLDSAEVSTIQMASGSLMTELYTLKITTDRTGPGYIIGRIERAHPFQAGVAYAFEGPDNTVQFSSLGQVTNVTVVVSPGLVPDFPFGGAINREYDVAVAGSGAYDATLRLHYLDAELNGAQEADNQIWHFQSPWTEVGRTGADAVANWVEQAGLADLSGRWALSDDLNVVQWSGAVSGAWELAGNWNVIQGAPNVPPSTNDIVELGAGPFANQPTISTPVQVRSLSFGSAQPVTLGIAAGGSLELAGNGGDIAGNWTNNVTHSIQVGNQSLHTGGIFQMSDGIVGHAINLQIGSGSVTIGGNLQQSGDAGIQFSGAGVLRLGADYVRTGGSFTAGSGTVVYGGAGAQEIAGGISYNHLVIDKPSGTATIPTVATVTGNLTVTNLGALQLAADLTVTGDVTVESGATLVGGSAVLRAGGGWKNAANSFVPDLGRVHFNGTANQSILGDAFHHLTVDKPGGQLSLAASLSLGGDLDLTAGTLELGSFTANRAALGGTLNMAPGTILKIGTGSAFPQLFATRTIADASTVIYNGTGAQVVTENNYGNLVLVNGGASPKTLAGNTTVRGDLTIETNATLNGGIVSLTVQGNWDNRGGFVPDTCAVTLAGSGKTISGANAFHDLTVPGGYTASASITANGEVTISGSLDAGSGVDVFEGDVTVSGSFLNSGTVRFAGTGPQTLTLGSGFNSSGTVEFNGTISPTLAGVAPPTLTTVVINNTGGVSPPTGWTIGGDFTVSAGAAFRAGPFTHHFGGSFLADGSVTSSGTLEFSPAIAATVRINGLLFQSSGLVDFAGSSAITLAGGPVTFQSVTLRNTHPSGITPAAAWSLNGNLQIETGAVLHGGGFQHTVLGNWFTDGGFDGQTSTVVFNGLSDIGGVGSAVFNHVQIPGTAAGVDDYSVAGDFTVNGTYDGTGSTVSFVGSGPSLIGGTATPLIFDGLVVAKSAAIARLGAALDSLNLLTVQSGTLDAVTFAITEDPLGGVLTVAGGGLLRLGGTTTLPSFATYALDPAGTVEYYGNGSQTITAADYGSLASSGTGARVLPGGATVRVAGMFQPGTNAYTILNSTVSFNGAGNQVIPAFNYFNLASEGSGTRQLSTLGLISIALGFSPGGNAYTVTGSTVNFNGGAQTIPGFRFHHLQLGAAGIKTMAAPIFVEGDFLLLAGTLADAGFTATVQGNVDNRTSAGGTGAIRLQNGAGIHRLTGIGGYGNLDLDDPAGAVLDVNDLLVRQTLGLTTGILSAPTNRVIIGPTGTVARATGHVAGPLQKPVAAGATSRLFEIGDLTAYTPISVSFANVTTAGNLTAQAFVGDAPQIATSGLLPSRSVNRFWRLIGTGVAFNNYSASLQYLPSDLDPSTDPLSIQVAVQGAATWALPGVLNRTATSIQAGPITTFGDLAAGLSAIAGSFTGITIQPNGNPLLQFSGNPGQVYRIQATTNLVPPIPWLDISTNQAAQDGTFQYEDILGTNYPIRFYRSATP